MALDFAITTGKKNTALRCTLYGIEGVGKTTFASMFPNAVFIDVEDGSSHYDVARLPKPRDWTMLLNEIDSVSHNPDEVGTLVIDTADAAENMCVDYIISKYQKSSMEDWAYQAGWRYVHEEFGNFIAKLNQCIEAGINVVVIAHAVIIKFEQPDEQGAYDRYELKLHKGKSTNNAALLKEWSDLLLFANFKTDVMRDEKTKKVYASGGTKRVMFTQRRAAYDAKNRFGLEEQLPFDFKEIEHIFKEAPQEEPKQKPKPKPTPKTEPEPNPETPTILEGAKIEEVTPENVRQLHKLMDRDGITMAMLSQAVNANPKNSYTLENSIGDYSEKFIDSLVEHWDSVAKKAREFGLYDQDEIPF